MPKQVQVISNFHSRSLGKDEGIVESGTVLDDVDDALADKLESNGWVKVLSVSQTPAAAAPEAATEPATSSPATPAPPSTETLTPSPTAETGATDPSPSIEQEGEPA